jgi:CubicO group peptidase (beta-lactamase class C family)
MNGGKYMNNNQNDKWERLGELISDQMDEKDVPGVAVGILHKGEIKKAGFGVTNVDHPLPVTDQTLFQIGSITKTFTCTAIMRLVEMGKLDLDTTVQTYVPEFKVVDETASSQATIRHLLTHVGGWVGDYFDDTGSGEGALARYVANMADLEQLAPPGAVFSYNNAGFSLAGYIIEMVTGKSYQEALKELVLAPLGLTNSFLDAGDVITHRFAVGHIVSPVGPMVARPWPLPRCVYPAGGITCNLSDLLSYARFHLGDGKVDDDNRLLTSESLAQMQTPGVTIWESERVGLAWMIDDTHGTQLVSHGGGTLGQVSLFTLVPEYDFAIAIFTNADRGGLLNAQVIRWVLNEFLGVEIPNPKPIEATEEELSAYVGRYSRPFMDIELGMLGGKLIGQVVPKGGFPTKDSPPQPPPPPMSIGLCEKDRLLVLDGPFKDAKADVLRDPDGSTGWLRVSGRIHAPVQ